MSKLRAYLELFRLPNVFTAAADVLMGFLVTHAVVDEPALLAVLVASSAALYLAGMVLNDVFDFERDTQERPARPLPSGRISRAATSRLGYGLLGLGVVLGWSASVLAGELRSGVVATLLALCVLAYDGVLKKTPLGPLAMGGCRFLNVLLGMSAAPTWFAVHWLIAAGVGVYIVGVTWFARTEAKQSNAWQLAAATLVMGAGLVMLAFFPSWETLELREQAAFAFASNLGPKWYMLWAMLGLSIGYRASLAVFDPRPARVQMAVKHCLQSLIVLDAAVCFGARGMSDAVLILLLLLPTMFLGRWIYQT
jgi:hypothetical protein